MTIGDRTIAEAIRVSYAEQLRLGYRFNEDDIAKSAARLLKTLEKEMAK